MRKRNVHVQFWLDKKEAEAFNKKVKRSGLSREAYLRHLVNGLVPQDAPPHEGYETCSEEVFRGLILRCETREGAPSPRLAEWAQTLGRQIEGKVCDLRREGGVLTLALETDYGFAAVAGSVDLRDLDAARESYRRSLRELAGVLDLLLENTALFAAGTER